MIPVLWSAFHFKPKCVIPTNTFEIPLYFGPRHDSRFSLSSFCSGTTEWED